MLQFFRRFSTHQQGVALIELALVMPFLLLLFYGAIELTRYITIAQRVEKSAYALAAATSQYPASTAGHAVGELNQNEMNTVILPQFARLMAPYDDAEDRAVIISSVRKENDKIRIKWQAAGGGTLANGQVVSVVTGQSASYIAAPNQETTFTGEAATLLNGSTGMRPNENMIVAEVFFQYHPFLDQILAYLPLVPTNIVSATLVRRIYLRPRNGDIDRLPPTYP